MAVIQSEVRIERSPEMVFDSVSDPRSELEWNPKVRIMEKISDGETGPGTRFRAKWTKSPVVELEVVRFDRPHGWAYRNGGAIAVDLNIDLEPVDDGRATLLKSRFDARAHGPVRLVFPLLLRSLRREEARNMQLIKERVETSPPA
jgi:uncharacterized protein YndB with AHSA1/START domain